MEGECQDDENEWRLRPVEVDGCTDKIASNYYVQSSCTTCPSGECGNQSDTEPFLSMIGINSNEGDQWDCPTRFDGNYGNLDTYNYYNLYIHIYDYEIY